MNYLLLTSIFISSFLMPKTKPLEIDVIMLLFENWFVSNIVNIVLSVIMIMGIA